MFCNVIKDRSSYISDSIINIRICKAFVSKKCLFSLYLAASSANDVLMVWYYWAIINSKEKLCCNLTNIFSKKNHSWCLYCLWQNVKRYKKWFTTRYPKTIFLHQVLGPNILSALFVCSSINNMYIYPKVIYSWIIFHHSLL